MSTNQTSPTDSHPTEHLGRRLLPRATDFLPTSLLLSAFVLGAWTDEPWLVGGGSVLTAVVCLAEMRRRRERDGAVAHQSFAWHGRLGWGIAGLFVGIVAVVFWAPLLLEGAMDPAGAPVWLQTVLCLVLALVFWGGVQAWLRARARHIGSPSGHRLNASDKPARATSCDPQETAVADLLSRTQTMSVLALSEDLMIPTEKLRPHLEELIRRGLVGCKDASDDPLQNDQWVHLTFHGEQQLAAALQDTPAAA